jgi:hypothetical protein
LVTKLMRDERRALPLNPGESPSEGGRVIPVPWK